MKARILGTCIVWAIATVVLQGQISVTFGPQPVAPQGCLVCGTISNDTASAIGLPNPCPMVVRTLSGTVVWAPFCIQVPVIIQPGDTFVAVWPQVDNSNNQVPQGQYQLELTVPTLGVVTQVVQIVSPNEAAISALGAPRIGTNRPYVICSPSSPNLPYVMAASASQSPGIPLCPGVIVPLAIDPLFLLSQQPVNPFFSNFWGTLDGTGHTAQGFDPLINIPNVSGLVGFQFHVAAIAFDPLNTTCPFKVTYPFTVIVQ